ncbi:hypothetical protein JKP88DRAFT_351998 [Tribonema minus]|uniref:G-patch domain-containing protein n=1 Tax=Tribonema minus TaxID=303371 RepID=A0A835ZFT9_9STRA|nr:hypothetical protein JKP88DRAFT_351998 [Tribonema minus]
MEGKAAKRPERFHGAFTGGFSAGYFNTVGTAEGWAPSKFVSSRDRRAGGGEDGGAAAAAAAQQQRQRPEDFMDEEDGLLGRTLQEDGLLGRTLQAKEDFDTMGQTAAAAARQHAEAISKGSAIPGPAPLELIGPSSDPIGRRLLRAMGWREGQGVGRRVRRRPAAAAAAAAAPRTGETEGAAPKRPRLGPLQHLEDECQQQPQASLAAAGAGVPDGDSSRRRRQRAETQLEVEDEAPAAVRARFAGGPVTFAPDNAAAAVAVPPAKADAYGVGYDPYAHAPELAAALRAGSRRGAADAAAAGARPAVYRMSDAVRGGGGSAQQQQQRAPRGVPHERHGARPAVYRMSDAVRGSSRAQQRSGGGSAQQQRGLHGFAVDDEDDDAAFGDAAIEYDTTIVEDEVEVGGSGGAALSSAVAAWTKGVEVDAGEAAAALRRHARCPSDNRPPPVGFVVASIPLQKPTYWTPPEPPSTFVPRHQFSPEQDRARLEMVDMIWGKARGRVDAGQRGALLGEAPRVRGALLGEAPLVVTLQQGATAAAAAAAAPAAAPAAAAREVFMPAAFDGLKSAMASRFTGSSGTEAPPTGPIGLSMRAPKGLANSGTEAPPSGPIGLSMRAPKAQATAAQAQALPKARSKLFRGGEPEVLMPEARPAGLSTGGLSAATPKVDAEAEAAKERERLAALEPTRTVSVWRPSPLLCKRLNVPVPPASREVQWGTQAGRAQEKSTEIFHESIGKFAPSAAAAAKLPLLHGVGEGAPAAVTVGAGLVQRNGAAAAAAGGAQEPPAPPLDIEVAVKPPLDLFKRIFEPDSDSEAEAEAAPPAGPPAMRTVKGPAMPPLPPPQQQQQQQEAAALRPEWAVESAAKAQRYGASSSESELESDSESGKSRTKSGPGERRRERRRSKERSGKEQRRRRSSGSSSKKHKSESKSGRKAERRGDRRDERRADKKRKHKKRSSSRRSDGDGSDGGGRGVSRRADDGGGGSDGGGGGGGSRKDRKKSRHK